MADDTKLAATLRRVGRACQYTDDQRALFSLAESLESSDSPAAALDQLRVERDEARKQRDEHLQRADRSEQALDAATREIASLKHRIGELENELQERS